MMQMKSFVIIVLIALVLLCGCIEETAISTLHYQFVFNDGTHMEYYGRCHQYGADATQITCYSEKGEQLYIPVANIRYWQEVKE
jgi:hypothetical protein